MKTLSKILLVSALLIICRIQTTAQENIEQLLTEAENRVNARDYDNALKAVLEAETLLSGSDNAELSGRCRSTAAFIYSRKNEPVNAIKYYIRAGNDFLKIKQTGKIADINYRIGLEYMSIQAFEKAAEYFTKSHKINSENPKTIEHIGDCRFFAGQKDSAYIYYQILKKKAENLKDSTLWTIALQKNAEICNAQDKYAEALEYNLRLYDYFRVKGDLSKSSIVMNNIGFNYVFLKKYDEALTAFDEALKFAEKSEMLESHRADIHKNIGICSQNSGDIDKAIDHLQKALDVRTRENNSREAAVIENILALIYLKNKKDFYNAALASESAIENAKKSGDKELLKECLNTYSKILQAGNDSDKALEVYKQYLALRDSLLVEQRIKEQILSQKIFDLEKGEKELRLKIADEEVKDLAMKQLRLEAEKKEQEMNLLRKQKELEESEKERILQSLKLAEQQHNALLQQQHIKDLENEKAIKDLEIKKKEAQEKERQKELALLKSEKEKQKLLIEKQNEERKKAQWIFFFVGIISLLVLYGFVLTRKKNKALGKQNDKILQQNEELNQQNEEIKTQKEYLEKANDEITTQKQEIEKKNNEITDSIRYAQRIQTAVLPPELLISETMPEHFVFWRPKDIVSGDFYWMKDIGSIRVVAAADCTGHGVPGAFMSMLGISFLNEIVSHRDISTASEILDDLREMVKTALKQTGKSNEQKDGMDLALCVIDTSNKQLQFAGANNPLVFIRSGELKIIDPDKMPIGIHHQEKPFSNHILDIAEADIFYIYSDGFQDQFGGPSGRKFLTKNFKQMLLDIHDKPLEQQPSLIEEKLKFWMNFEDAQGRKYPQVDDILIIGIKI